MDIIVNTEDDKAALIEYIGRLPSSKRYVVTITAKKTKRTCRQNRLYRLWLSFISHETGNDIESLHKFFARKFLGVEFENVFDYNIEKPISTTRLDTEQFTEYLNNIEAFVYEFSNMILPHPEDLIFEQFEDRYGN